ncbi:MAG: phosphatase PAP2 family protein [Gemmatimonadota bacterium]|nr:phosphatase PAP2 family protein [Gemmatimonadota bacterium]
MMPGSVSRDQNRHSVRREHSLRLAVACCAGSLAALAALIGMGSLNALDRSVHRRVARGRSERLMRAARIASWGGEPMSHLGAAALAAIAVGRRKGARRSLPLLAASVGAVATHQGWKLIQRRARPPEVWRQGKREPAFPSGHTTTATAVSTAVAYVILRERMASPAVVLPVALSIPIFVGASRVILGEHWASDVIGGWVAGIGVGAASAAWYERRPRR